MRANTRPARGWNREHKWSRYPEAGRWSLYIDSSFDIRQPVKPWVDKILSDGHCLALHKHPWRTCVYDEIDACVKHKKCTPREAEKARAYLQLMGHPRHYGLWASGILVRRSRSQTNRLIAMAMAPFMEECLRDQIWLPHIIRLLRIEDKVKTIDAHIYKLKRFRYRGHK